jgi:hypothetical protein
VGIGCGTSGSPTSEEAVEEGCCAVAAAGDVDGVELGARSGAGESLACGADTETESTARLAAGAAGADPDVVGSAGAVDAADSGNAASAVGSAGVVDAGDCEGAASGAVTGAEAAGASAADTPTGCSVASGATGSEPTVGALLAASAT